MNKRIQYLENEIERLQEQLQSEKLLEEVWLYSEKWLPWEVRSKLQEHFNLNDDE